MSSIKPINWGDFVFVFGSNLAGRHGKGAALDARRFWGAQKGKGVGFSGQSYAIPTKDENLNVLPLNEIASYVKEFLEFARQNPDKKFMVSRIGCGLAGYNDGQIAPLFESIPDNVMLPAIWRDDPAKRIIVAGSRNFDDYEFMQDKLDFYLQRLDNPIIISGGAKGADSLAKRYAEERGLTCEVYPALWNRHGKGAGFLRNKVMAWAGTHLVAFPINNSPGTTHMIEYAKENGLNVRVSAYINKRQDTCMNIGM